MVEIADGTGAPGMADIEHEKLNRARHILASLRAPTRGLGDALESKPKDPMVLTALGFNYNENQEYEKAAEIFRRVLDDDSSSYWARVGLGDCYLQFGQFAEAVEMFEGLFRDGVRTAPLLGALSKLPQSLVTVDILSAIDSLNYDPKMNRDAFEAQRAFIKASALNKVGRHREAWKNAVAANDLKRRLLDRDYPTRSDKFTKDIVSARQRGGRAPAVQRVEKRVPFSLFVLGPSRSGRTTLESLLGKLPGVTRGYESQLTVQIRDALKTAGLFDGGRCYAMSPSAREAFRRLYVEQLEELGVERVFTSTQPELILDAYDIAEIIPNARFISLKRDIDDNALRIYMTDYANAKNFGESLFIDRTYNFLRQLHDTIDHLAATLPDISRVIRYEDMIENPRSVVNIAAELCGLPVYSGELPRLGDDRGCSDPYKPFMRSALAGGDGLA